MDDLPVKLVIAGEMGAGKTTVIRSISDCEPISTEVPISTGAMGDKSTTTVAFDYSTVSLGDDRTLHIYGMPGQDRLDFMRPIVADGAMGAILLLDATSPTLIEDCANWVVSLRGIDPLLQLVIGVSKTDLNPEFSIRAVRAALDDLSVPAPVVTVDPRVDEQCRQLVRLLLAVLG